MDSNAIAGASSAPELAREITDSVNAQLPTEKARAEREMFATASDLANTESDHVDGRGQAIGSIPPIIYMRWNLMIPGCWQDKEFVEEFLFDNPRCRYPGYRPNSKPVYFTMSPMAKLYREKRSKL